MNRSRAADHLQRLREENGLLRARLQELEQVPAECRRYEEYYQALFQQAFDGTLLIDAANALVLEMNDGLRDRLGYKHSAAVRGMPLSRLFCAEQDGLSLLNLLGTKRELRFARRDGSVLEAEVTGVRFPCDAHRTLRLMVQDISERKLLEQSLRHEATHDHLTGLPNRKLFAERLQQEISYHRRRQMTLAVMVLDLDHFKQVNDNLGHRAGDALLRDFAERLRTTVREYDLVARFGGDEFQIGLIDVRSFTNVAHVAQKLLDLCVAPFQVERQHIDYVSASIGIALYPGDGEDAEALFTAADAALYEAKRRGKRRFAFFRPTVADQPPERTELNAAGREPVAIALPPGLPPGLPRA